MTTNSAWLRLSLITLLFGRCANGQEIIVPLFTYASLTEKTILAPYSLPNPPDSIVSDLPTEKSNAIAKIESEFTKLGITVVQDGPHFVRLIRQDNAQYFLTNMPLRGALLEARAKRQAPAGTQVPEAEEIIPAGVINVFGVWGEDMLKLYDEITPRNVLRPTQVPSFRVRLKTQTVLSKEEVIYALETVIQLNGLAIVEDGPRFVQALPLLERGRARIQAPTPDPEAKLLDPGKVPTIGVSIPPRPMTEIERALERWGKAFHDFVHAPGPRDRSAQRLLEFYAHLSDKTAEPSKEFEAVPIVFHVKTPLTREELLYAIETTFRLNNLTITNVGSETVGLLGKPSTVTPVRKMNLPPK